jgi:NAD(P)-dependent dehydrogenase (short-subunit alcohol dehydrogenase family)
VNNAGYSNVSSIEETSMEDFRAQVETNLWGVVNVTKAAIPFLRQQGHGHIVQFSSIGGRIGAPGLAPYQAAKWAFCTDWVGSSMQQVEPREESKHGRLHDEALPRKYR